MDGQPSNPASQPGSPAGGGTGIDGAEIARRMILATEAAASAASQAVRALEDLKSSNEKGDRSWYKLVQKPGCFDPATRELEISMWKEWAWSFEQYLSNIDPLFTEDIKVLRSNPANFVDSSVQHDDEKKRGALLYSLLASLTKQRPLMVVRSVLNNNGLEAYRQLLLSNEPVNKNRALSLLNVIMNWPQFSGKASFLSQILRLENAFYEYDKLGSKLAEELRTAVLLRSVTGQLKVWLQLQIDDSFGYDKVRELILSYERSTAKWTEQMVLGTSVASDTSAPMEVDRIQKGKRVLERKVIHTRVVTDTSRASRRVIRREKENFLTKEKGKPRIQSRMAKAMTARVMAVNGQIVPKERVMANTKAVVTMAKVASQQFSVGIVVAIIKLQTVSRTIMCVKFLMNKIHHNNSSSNNSLLHLRLSLPSHSAFQIQQRLQQHQPQHIVLTVYLHMMIRVIWFSICVAVMWTFQTCEFVL